MSASACIISALNSIYREISARGLCILIIPTSGTQSRHGEELKNLEIQLLLQKLVLHLSFLSSRVDRGRVKSRSWVKYVSLVAIFKRNFELRVQLCPVRQNSNGWRVLCVITHIARFVFGWRFACGLALCVHARARCVVLRRLHAMQVMHFSHCTWRDDAGFGVARLRVKCLSLK